MERSEPTLVPEWLRSTGSVAGGGSSAHHSALSSLRSDASSSNHTRNKSSKNDHDSPRSVFLERTSSSNSRRSSSSNGFSRHPYSSFSRSHRDKDRDKDKERFFSDHWERDSSDPMASILPGRSQKDVLRRSRSMVSGKQSDVLPQRIKSETRNSGDSSHIYSNGVTPRGNAVTSIQKAAFDKDFPSLGADERQGLPDFGRVSSPGLSSAVQSLPIGNSSMIGGEGWTSALAEVPSVIGSNSNGFSSVQPAASISTVTPGPPNATGGLNMAEALAQAPPRARTAPQLSVQTQRLEEMAIKQSRQLIPMTPMSKASALNSSDKTKPKQASRTAEMVVAGKGSQQHFSSSNPASQSLRGVRPDTSKASHVGKFLVLKPSWENGVSSTPKDVSSPTNNTSSRVGNSQLAATPATASAALRCSSNSRPLERKTTTSALNAGTNIERRPSSAHAQSRNDFFNLMRKKSSVSQPSALTESGSTVPALNPEKLGEDFKEAAIVPVSIHSAENGGEVNGNGDICENSGSVSDGMECNSSPNAADLEEEEARFLRSLGWDENADEDEGLTQEEINSFIEEYMKLKPSTKLRGGVQPRFPIMPVTREAISDEAPVNSSNSEATE